MRASRTPWPPRPGSLLPLAVLVLTLAACDNGAGPSTPELAQIQLSTSLVVLADADSARLEATLLNRDGAPLEQLPAGTVLRWTSKDTSIATVLGGLVQAWRPGETEIHVQAGTVRASARVRVQAVPPTLTLLAGDGQGGGRGETLARRLQVRLQDAHRRPVRDAEVEFAATAGGGTFAPALQRTDSAGIASASWTLGAVPGEQKAEARLVGQSAAPLPFTARAMRQIAFVSRRDGNEEIYLMNEDGSLQRNLTQNAAADRYPSWSRDGRKIYFYSDRGGSLQPYVMDADGSQPTPLTSLAADALSDRSPQGSETVFASGGDIYLANAGASTSQNAPAGTFTDRQHIRSPDGTQIAFIRTGPPISQPSRGQHWLMVMNTDGSQLRSLQYSADSEFRSPDWSPDGKSIAYTTQWRLTTPTVIIIDADGTRSRAVPSDRTRVGSEGLVWSPDGRMVAYTLIDGSSQYGGAFPRYLALANAADGRSIALLGVKERNPCPVPDYSAYSYCIRHDSGVSWAADGTKVAFTRALTRSGVSDSAIYVETVGGSAGETRLSTSPAKDHNPVWRP